MGEIDEHWRQWEMWVDRIYEQLVRVHHRRFIRDQLHAMLLAQGNEHSSLFWSVYDGQYVEAQASAIRRLVDKSGPDVISLRRLIGQVMQHSHLITREWYVDKFSTGHEDRQLWGDRIGKAHLLYGKANGGGLDKGKLNADLERLQVAAAVEAFATSRVAHDLDLDQPPDVTWDQFNRAINEVAEVARAYYLLVKNATVWDWEPVIQGDWKAPFRTALAPSFDKPGQGRA